MSMRRRKLCSINLAAVTNEQRCAGPCVTIRYNYQTSCCTPIMARVSVLFLHIYYIWKWSRGSVVGIATAYGLDDRADGVRVPVGPRIFYSPRRPDRLWSPPTSYPMGTGGSFSGVKRPGREVDHKPPASAEVKKRIYTSIPPYVFMA
jgi:hypothetical protein